MSSWGDQISLCLPSDTSASQPPFKPSGRRQHSAGTLGHHWPPNIGHGHRSVPRSTNYPASLVHLLLSAWCSIPPAQQRCLPTWEPCWAPLLAPMGRFRLPRSPHILLPFGGTASLQLPPAPLLMVLARQAPCMFTPAETYSWGTLRRRMYSNKGQATKG